MLEIKQTPFHDISNTLIQLNNKTHNIKLSLNHLQQQWLVLAPLHHLGAVCLSRIQLAALCIPHVGGAERVLRGQVRHEQGSEAQWWRDNGVW